MKKIIALLTLFLGSCTSPTVEKTENEVKVKAGNTVRVVVTVHKDGSVTTTSYPINWLEATLSGITGGLTKFMLSNEPKPEHNP